MDFEFTNGNKRQRELWAEAAHHLLNVGFDELPFEITVTFEDPDIVGGLDDDEFAHAEWTYGSLESTVRVRNDAPGFGDLRPGMVALAASMGLRYSAEQFYLETAIHELGHAWFAALPASRRLRIAEMFGAASDDPEDLFPENRDWADRIGEAIAETFKEAFLPRRFRVFPNRTNIHLPYYRFPEFRAHFRTLEVVNESEEVGETGWFRTARVDAMRYGTQSDQAFLPLPYPPKGGTLGGVASGLYFSVIFGSTEESHPYYRAHGVASWNAVLTDSVEVRDPIKVPGLAEFFEHDPENKEGRVSVGDLVAYGVFDEEPPITPPDEPPPEEEFETEPQERYFWLSVGRASYQANAEMEVEDDEGTRWAISWHLSMRYQTANKFRTVYHYKTNFIEEAEFVGWVWEFVEDSEEEVERVKGYVSSGEKKFKKEGSAVATVDIAPVEYETELTEQGMSGLEVLQAFQGLGESPSYDVNAVPFSMSTIENHVEYVFNESVEPESPFPEDLRDWVWDRMQSLWVIPLTKEEGIPGESEVIQLAGPPQGELQSGGTTRGRVPVHYQVR